MSLLENIKSLSTIKGVSIPKLEKELGFGIGSIYNWEKSSPSIDKIIMVAEYFGVSLYHLLYGFDASKFSNLTNIAKGDRTLTQFSLDTGMDQNEVVRICLGYPYDRPSIETVKKIAANNQHEILFAEDDFLEAAGYVSARQLTAARERAFEELREFYGNQGFYVVHKKVPFDEVHISRPTGSWMEVLSLDEFLKNGFELLDKLKIKSDSEDVSTIAAHHGTYDFTEEELDEIERFKQFVKMRREQRDEE